MSGLHEEQNGTAASLAQLALTGAGVGSFTNSHSSLSLHPTPATAVSDFTSVGSQASLVNNNYQWVPATVPAADYANAQLPTATCFELGQAGPSSLQNFTGPQPQYLLNVQQLHNQPGSRYYTIFHGPGTLVINDLEFQAGMAGLPESSHGNFINVESNASGQVQPRSEDATFDGLDMLNDHALPNPAELLPGTPSLASVLGTPHSDTTRDRNTRVFCSDCGKRFGREADMVRHHESIHEGKRHPCAVQGCGKSYTRKDKLVEHQRKSHARSA